MSNETSSQQVSHSLGSKVEAPETCNSLPILFRLSFAHKTGQMPQNSINVSCKLDLVRSLASLFLKVKTVTSHLRKLAEVVSSSPGLDSTPTPFSKTIRYVYLLDKFVAWTNFFFNLLFNITPRII